MKLRISIILLGASLLFNSGCSSVKTAYDGREQSHFTNPAKIAALTNSQSGLAPIAEPPTPSPDVAVENSGWTGPYHMTGMSTQPQFQQNAAPADNASSGSWGGALSTR